MIHCQRCQNEIPDEDCLRRVAELGWIHPEEIDAYKEIAPKIQTIVIGVTVFTIIKKFEEYLQESLKKEGI